MKGEEELGSLLQTSFRDVEAKGNSQAIWVNTNSLLLSPDHLTTP